MSLGKDIIFLPSSLTLTRSETPLNFFFTSKRKGIFSPFLFRSKTCGVGDVAYQKYLTTLFIFSPYFIIPYSKFIYPIFVLNVPKSWFVRDRMSSSFITRCVFLCSVFFFFFPFPVQPQSSIPYAYIKFSGPTFVNYYDWAMNYSTCYAQNAMFFTSSSSFSIPCSSFKINKDGTVTTYQDSLCSMVNNG